MAGILRLDVEGISGYVTYQSTAVIVSQLSDCGHKLLDRTRSVISANHEAESGKRSLLQDHITSLAQQFAECQGSAKVHSHVSKSKWSTRTCRDTI